MMTRSRIASHYNQLLNLVSMPISKINEKQAATLIMTLKDQNTVPNDQIISLFYKLVSTPAITPEVRELFIKNLLPSVVENLPQNETHPLYYVMSCADTESLGLLLKYCEFNLNSQFTIAGVPDLLLHHIVHSLKCCSKTRIRIIDLLLSHGADITAESHCGQDIMYCMITSSFYSELLPLAWDNKVADFLYGRGAPIDTPNRHGRTPLHEAVNCVLQPIKAITWLLDHGADINRREDIYGYTPLFEATDWNLTDIVLLLLERGADVNITDFDGNTPLHCACDNCPDRDDIQPLLEFGSKVNVRNLDGETPLSLIDPHDRERRNYPAAKLFMNKFAMIKFKEEIDVSLEVTHLSDLDTLDNFPRLRAYYEKCLKELRKMNGVILYDSVTMYEVLYNNTCFQLALLLKKGKFEKRFHDSKLHSSFPIYNYQFKKKVQKAKDLKNSMDEIDHKLCSTIGHIFPIVVIDIIARMLYIDELDI